MKQLIAPLLLLLFACRANAQAPGVEWGIRTESGQVGVIRSGDGYVVTGTLDRDIYVFNTDDTGAIRYRRRMGGSDYDYARNILETPDGGYLVLNSVRGGADGDVTSTKGAGGNPWLVKLDSMLNIVWDKSYGGTVNNNQRNAGGNVFYSIRPAHGGGYIMGGIVWSDDGDITDKRWYGASTAVGFSNCWAMKIDDTGKVIWSKTYGGNGGYNVLRTEYFADIRPCPSGGYIAIGNTFSENQDGDVTGYMGASDIWLVKLDDTGKLEWQKTLGGSGYDYAGSVFVMPDGHYLVFGSTTSVDEYIHSPYGNGKYDLWLAKIHATTQDTIWTESLGGGEDEAGMLYEAPDGGYFMIGRTSSKNGDVDTTTAHGGNDIWVVKLDSTARNIEWQRLYGGSLAESAAGAAIISATQAVIAGSSSSADGDVIGRYGGIGNGWLFKLGACPTVATKWLEVCDGDTAYFNGRMLTQAGTYYDTITAVTGCPEYVTLHFKVRSSKAPYVYLDGNELIVNQEGDFRKYTWLFNGSVLTHNNNKSRITVREQGNYRVVVTDEMGCVKDTTVAIPFVFDGCLAPDDAWRKTYGGGSTDVANAIRATPDGGYIVIGQSNSTTIPGHNGNYDYWIIKTDAQGDTLWTKAYGGSAIDYGRDIRPTADGGYIAVGESRSNDGYVHGHKGTTSSYDAWVLKLNASGDTVWTRSYGGAAADGANLVRQTQDGGYLIGGYTASSTDDLDGTTATGNYGWVLRLNAQGDILWQQRLSGNSNFPCLSVLELPDGSILATADAASSFGGTLGNTDIRIAKYTASGNVAWEKHYGGSNYDYAKAMEVHPDGGFVLMGNSSSSNHHAIGQHGGNYDMLIIRADTAGAVIRSICIGGSGSNDNATGNSLGFTSDGGYIFPGKADSYDFDLAGNTATGPWLVKTDSLLNIEWQKIQTGITTNINSIVVHPDDSYTITGHSTNDYVIIKSKSCRTCIDRTDGYVCPGDLYAHNNSTYAPGLYRDSTQSGDGCYQIAALLVRENPVYTVSDYAVICKGDAYDLAGTLLYTPGTYTGTYQTVGGCDSVVTLALIVDSISRPVVTASGGTLTTASGYVSYQWLDDNGPLSGATSVSYSPLNSGNYRVVVTGQNGCADTADAVAYTVSVADRGFAPGDLSVYPNPARQHIVISLSQSADLLDISVTGIDGRELIRTQRFRVDGPQMLPVSDLTPGIYLLRINAGSDREAIRKIIIAE